MSTALVDRGRLSRASRLTLASLCVCLAFCLLVSGAGAHTSHSATRPIHARSSHHVVRPKHKRPSHPAHRTHKRPKHAARRSKHTRSPAAAPKRAAPHPFALIASSFATQVTYGVGGHPNGVAVADFNGDGIPDLATANGNDNDVSVLLGNGDGTFQGQVTYPAGGNPTSIAVADFNGDGHPDIAVANQTDNTVSILLGNGDGTFHPQRTSTNRGGARFHRGGRHGWRRRAGYRGRLQRQRAGIGPARQRRRQLPAARRGRLPLEHHPVRGQHRGRQP